MSEPSGERTPGPDWYALADGRQLFELERDELFPACQRAGMGAWDIHCLISAMEHRFRRGAKPGEDEDDKVAEEWWLAQITWSGLMIEANETRLRVRIDEERKKVGR